ncbi:hypothetical protein [Kordia sp.]|uniref:hypothetical protein n=1 Tax=Kordia sp. TaxID=1965332 RepID=UPI003B5B311B
MKTLLKISLLAILFIPKLHAQDFDLIGYIEIDENRRQKTKIKSITEESDCYIDQEKPPFTFEDCEKTYKEKYDKSGNLISLKVYDSNTLESTTTFEYENNKIVRIEEDDGEDIETKVYSYNLTGKLIFKKEYENNTLEASTSYKYNSNSLLTEEVYKRPKSTGFGSTPYRKTVYKYNSDGKCIYEGELNEAGLELDVRIYEYSNNGLTRIEKDKRDDTYVKQYEKTKDARGNELESIIYDYKGNLEKRMVQTYDANNKRLTYEEYGSNNILVKRVTETYNKYNDPKDYTVFYPKDQTNVTEGTTRITKYWYKYDKKGNWVQRASYQDGEEFSSYEIQRTIRYY